MVITSPVIRNACKAVRSGNVPFVNKLIKQYPDKKVVMFDERFTSVIAQRAILDSGIGRMARRNKALVDEVSATIILESFMDSKQYKEI